MFYRKLFFLLLPATLSFLRFYNFRMFPLFWYWGRKKSCFDDFGRGHSFMCIIYMRVWIPFIHYSVGLVLVTICFNGRDWGWMFLSWFIKTNKHQSTKKFVNFGETHRCHYIYLNFLPVPSKCRYRYRKNEHYFYEWS